MHVRVRTFGKPDTIVVVESKLTKIEQFRRIIKEKFGVDPALQRLLYGGKLLENGYTFHDYNIKLNDVIQLMEKIKSEDPIKNEDVDRSKQTQDKDKNSEKEVKYEDAKSTLYAVGDLIDMKDKEQGAWFEGKIVRIVYNTDIPSVANKHDTKSKEEQKAPEHESDSENTPPGAHGNKESPKCKEKGIVKYFTKIANSKKRQNNSTADTVVTPEDNLLFQVQLDADEEDSGMYCKEKEIRPRAHRVIDVSDLKPGQKVMVNYNTDRPNEKGYWYDITVQEVKKLRTSFEIVGTLYLGLDSIPQNDTVVKVHDKIFAIEKVVPLQQRTEDDKMKMVTAPEKRSAPLNCLSCRDDEDAPCRECGCYICLGKANPEKIILCDECNNGFHMECLNPPLTELPEEDWYCPSCKRDPNHVIAPGAAKQTKKSGTKSNRDWGRGMACVGKTKTCAMPANHFGPIPGIEVGMCWRFRIQLSESGIHRPPVSGIHGRDVEGAYSIVLSGGYEDDVDNGYEFTYTGSGGRDLSGNKRTAEQSCDQTLTRENKALARNCAIKEISESGGDAGDNWKAGKPVRVVRSYKMLKHFPKYAPKEGIRYDGIYKVVKYYPEKGLSGFRVWKYLLRRDDPSPAPWEPEAKQFDIIYPDGYLEAEAEKKALKEKNGKGAKNVKGTKKRKLKESNPISESESEDSPPGKKAKINKDNANTKKRGRPSKGSLTTSPNQIAEIFVKKTPKKANMAVENFLTEEEMENIKVDTLNSKLWDECLEVCKNKGKKEFVEHVAQVFLCIICQEVAVCPVTTPCLHNFCMGCLKLAFKSNGVQTCPCCRQDLSKYEIEPNENLKMALRSVMTGYDAGKK